MALSIQLNERLSIHQEKSDPFLCSQIHNTSTTVRKTFLSNKRAAEDPLKAIRPYKKKVRFEDSFDKASNASPTSFPFETRSLSSKPTQVTTLFKNTSQEMSYKIILGNSVMTVHNQPSQFSSKSAQNDTIFAEVGSEHLPNFHLLLDSV
ncbi:hypothetical protein RRG08_023157 [Elysia crispata]|uniref:Uncharacterized protein n=1 Tax=Elysia crispata TaxID=231223 RepID=A0AAE0XMV7_9GAST|nr:hypothetical protein RRG08_023157 [Elysia crispata]